MCVCNLWANKNDDDGGDWRAHILIRWNDAMLCWHYRGRDYETESWKVRGWVAGISMSSSDYTYITGYTLRALLLPSQLPGRRLMPHHRRPPKKKDCARLTLLVRFSSIVHAPTSATETSVQLDLQSGTVSDSWTCHAVRYIFLERKKNDYCPNVPWSFRLWLTVACLSIFPNAVSISDASYSSHLLLFAVYVLSMNVFSISWMIGC